MHKIIILFFFHLLSIFGKAQDKTPIASYPYETELFYQRQLKSLEKNYKESNNIYILDSLANLAFIYKDWETSIHFAQKAVEFKPNAKRYFLLGGSAGFRALQGSMLSSLKYVNIMKPAFEEAVKLEPNNTLYLRAKVDVLVSLPSLLGGSVEEAIKNIEKIKSLNTLEGLIAEGYLNEKIGYKEIAKKVYKRAFEYLDENYANCSESFIEYLKKNRRNLAYDLGRIASDYNLNFKWSQCALNYFEKTYRLNDTVPLAWVYLNRARLAKIESNKPLMKDYIEKTLLFKKEYPKLEKLISSLQL